MGRAQQGQLPSAPGCIMWGDLAGLENPLSSWFTVMAGKLVWLVVSWALDVCGRAMG